MCLKTCVNWRINVGLRYLPTDSVCDDFGLFTDPELKIDIDEYNREFMDKSEVSSYCVNMMILFHDRAKKIEYC